jgi:hypothetical protein
LSGKNTASGKFFAAFLKRNPAAVRTSFQPWASPSFVSMLASAVYINDVLLLRRRWFALSTCSRNGSAVRNDMNMKLQLMIPAIDEILIWTRRTKSITIAGKA